MTSNSNPNPYHPPTPVASTHNRISRFIELVRRFPWTTSSRFSRGELVIVDGIAFYLDPDDSSIAFAASPSATNTNERMNLIISETIRVLPTLLTDSPSLTRILRGRRLVVRMLNEYSGSSNAVVREEVLAWDILNAIIDGDRE
ncbi:hypothetical protein [Novipirellula rosea]